MRNSLWDRCRLGLLPARCWRTATLAAAAAASAVLFSQWWMNVGVVTVASSLSNRHRRFTGYRLQSSTDWFPAHPSRPVPSRPHPRRWWSVAVADNPTASLALCMAGCFSGSVHRFSHRAWLAGLVRDHSLYSPTFRSAWKHRILRYTCNRHSCRW